MQPRPSPISTSRPGLAAQAHLRGQRLAPVIDLRAAAKTRRRARRDPDLRALLLAQRRMAVELRNRMAL